MASHFCEFEVREKQHLLDLQNKLLENTPSGLSIKEFRDVLLFPLNFFQTGGSPAYQCGAYDATGKIIRASILTRGSNVLSTLPSSVDVSNYHDVDIVCDTALYGGLYTTHYGHSLLETISRLWAVSQFPSVPIVFSGAAAIRSSSLSARLVDCYKKTPDTPRIIPSNVSRIKRLILPSPSLVIRSYGHRSHASTLREAFFSLQSDSRAGQLIYLSRSRLRRNVRPILNEAEVEATIRRLGGLVYYPEENGLDDQLRTISSYDVLVTPLGSAAHTLLLLSRRPRVVYLCPDRINSNYLIQDCILNDDSYYLKCLFRASNHENARHYATICHTSILEGFLQGLSGFSPMLDQASTARPGNPNITNSVLINPTDSYLDKLGIAYNTDKASVNWKRNPGDTDKPGHDYLRKYELFFDRLRGNEALCFLELGAGPDWNIGASTRLWRAYFKTGDIHVADTKPSVLKLQDQDVYIHVGDLGDLDFLANLSRNQYDVILDDASHGWHHQQCAFSHLFPSVRPGGLYIVEDIHTSFGPMRDRYHQGQSIDTFAFLAALACRVAGKGRPYPVDFPMGKTLEDNESTAGSLTYWKEIDMITFVHHSCILVKKQRS